MRFNYLNTANLIFGRGALDGLGDLLRSKGSKALVVTGRSSAKKSGLLDRALDLLSKSGAGAVVFDKVAPNPTTSVCYEAAGVARMERCDVVLGLGGGSALDAAKGAAFSVHNTHPLPEYIFGLRQQEAEVLPIVLVPTTCGTGTEGNCFSVLTDPLTGDKKSLRVPSIFAAASIIDPALMNDLPPSILAEVGFDAMCHLMEAYQARNAQPMTDIMSLDGLRRSHKSLLACYEGAGTEDDWDNLAWASTLGGMSIGPGCVVAPHGLEHPLSGRKDDIAHARGLAAICPAVYEKTLSASPNDFLGRYDELSRILGGKGHQDFVEIVVKTIERLGLKGSLTSLGLSEADLPWLTQNAFKISGPGIKNHPVVFDEAGVEGLYRQSL